MTRTDPAQATRILREAMMAVAPDQALSSPRTMDEALAQQRWLLRVFTTMFGAIASIACKGTHVGRTIRIIDAPGTILGVMPDGMHFPFNADIWLPAGAMPAAITGQPREARGYFAVGRLTSGVTVEQSRAELQAIGKRLTEQYPKINKDLWPHADPFAERILGPQIRLLFWSLMVSRRLRRADHGRAASSISAPRLDARSALRLHDWVYCLSQAPLSVSLAGSHPMRQTVTQIRCSALDSSSHRRSRDSG